MNARSHAALLVAARGARRPRGCGGDDEEDSADDSRDDGRRGDDGDDRGRRLRDDGDATTASTTLGEDCAQLAGLCAKLSESLRGHEPRSRLGSAVFDERRRPGAGRDQGRLRGARGELRRARRSAEGHRSLERRDAEPRGDREAAGALEPAEHSRDAGGLARTSRPGRRRTAEPAGRGAAPAASPLPSSGPGRAPEQVDVRDQESERDRGQARAGR